MNRKHGRPWRVVGATLCALGSSACEASTPIDASLVEVGGERAAGLMTAGPESTGAHAATAADGGGADDAFTARLRPRDDHRCLEADSGTVGIVDVEMWECNDLPQQLWTFSPFPDEEGWRIQNALDPLKCLDADPATASSIRGESAVVQLWICNDQSRQRWLIQPNGKIQNLLLARRDPSFGFLDADLTTPDDGGTVQLWTARDQSNQSWERLPP